MNTIHRSTPHVVGNLLISLTLLAQAGLAQQTVSGFGGATVSVAVSGAWSVGLPICGWQLAGSTGVPANAVRANAGTDALGDFQELLFDYQDAGSRTASIRTYAKSPVVLFSILYNDMAANGSAFPTFSSYPQISHMSFNGMFAGPDFKNLAPDSPWLFFDAANAFILSPLSNFMTAATSKAADNSIASGISHKIQNLPAGFAHRVALVFGKGINQTFQTWGGMMTTFGGKTRPANDADPLLKSISYWTDNGATYYYNPGSMAYTDTLRAVRDEFDAKGVRLGSMQLDSWWYPKGPDDSWSSHSGIWTYTAAPSLFAPDLASFQTTLGAPLVTHARWIDAASPYRSQYKMSGDVIVDPAYWDSVAKYLKASGTTTYEQDWLGLNAQTAFNLEDAGLFLGSMSAAMAKQGISIQYCMANPAHFLQTTRYSNVTTIRASQDRFRSDVWDNFFYASRLASAIGVWPYADVFMSTETDNLIAATLSAGPIGVGDALGQLSKENLLRAVRPDGTIVKPDVSATPIDSVYLADAAGVDAPMIASASTDFGGGVKTNYIFSYTRGSNSAVTISPGDFGIAGDAYLFDYKAGTGRTIAAGSAYTFNLSEKAGYFVLAPVLESGIAFLGDRGNFVTAGKARIPALAEVAGTTESGVDAEIAFAPGEQYRTIFGFSSRPVQATAIQGHALGLRWDSSTQMFSMRVHPAAGGETAHIRLVTNAAIAQAR